MRELIEYRVLVRGILVLIIGYVVWAAISTLIVHFYEFHFPGWSSLLLISIGILIPVATGVYCAYKASVYPVLHGLFAGLIGSVAVVVAIGIMLSSIPIKVSVLPLMGWLLVSTTISWMSAAIVAAARK